MFDVEGMYQLVLWWSWRVVVGGYLLTTRFVSDLDFKLSDFADQGLDRCRVKIRND